MNLRIIFMIIIEIFLSVCLLIKLLKIKKVAVILSLFIAHIFIRTVLSSFYFIYVTNESCIADKLKLSNFLFSLYIIIHISTFIVSAFLILNKLTKFLVFKIDYTYVMIVFVTSLFSLLMVFVWYFFNSGYNFCQENLTCNNSVNSIGCQSCKDIDLKYPNNWNNLLQSSTLPNIAAFVPTDKEKICFACDWSYFKYYEERDEFKKGEYYEDFQKYCTE